MKFDDFIKRGLVRTASKDLSLAKSLLKNAKRDLEFLRNIKISEHSCRKMMTNHYEVLRSILEAISAIRGYKIYSHEAFAYFLKDIGEENLSIKFDRFRKIRNSINYYGEDISIKDAEENVSDIKRIIDILIKKYLGDLS